MAFHASAQQSPAQPGWQSPIATDRPAVTDSSVVVPKGVIQFENGILDTAAQSVQTLDFSETLVRFGITSATELRFTAPDYYYGVSPPGQPSGFGDLILGAKQQLVNAPRFQASAVLSLSFPSGAHGLSSGRYDPSIQFPWSGKLSDNLTAAGMLSVYATAQNGKRGELGEATFLFDRQLTRAWDAFVEYAGDFPDSGGPRHLLHFGTAYKLTPRQQVDFHVGAGLSAASVSRIIGAGYSFCFGIARQ